MKKSILSTAILLVAFISNLLAQPSNTGNTMEQTMLGSGKIYVAIGVLSIILLGIFIYLFMIDAKLKRLEEKSRQ